MVGLYSGKGGRNLYNVITRGLLGVSIANGSLHLSRVYWPNLRYDKSSRSAAVGCSSRSITAQGYTTSIEG